MGKLEEEVAQLIEFQYGSKAEFARKINLPEQTLYTLLSHSFANASLATVMPVAAELSLDPFELANGKLVQIDRTKGSVDVPFFGSIAADQPIEPGNAEGTFPIPAVLHADYPDAFMLRVGGTSMNRVLPDGYFALIDPCDTADTFGQLYAVAVGDGAVTIKHVRVLSNGLELRPDSDDPTHHPMVFDYAHSDAPQVRVIGRVVWHCPPVGA